MGKRKQGKASSDDEGEESGSDVVSQGIALIYPRALIGNPVEHYRRRLRVLRPKSQGRLSRAEASNYTTISRGCGGPRSACARGLDLIAAAARDDG